MKNIMYSIFCCFFFIVNSTSQVGINTTDPKAQLEIKSSNQATPSNIDGILIPKIDAFPVTNPTTAQNGMMVFLTQDVGLNLKGFYYWDFGNLVWKNVGGATAGWLPDGNSNGAIRSIGTNDNFALPFETNGTEKMRLLANGNLGIGSTLPTSKLEIRQDIANAINTNVFRLTNFVNNGDNLGSSVVFGSGGTTATNQHWAKIDGFHSGAGNTNIAFATSTGANYEAATEKMRITGNGNVGINVINPSAKLDVGGEIKIGTTTATAPTIGAGGMRWDGTNIQFSNGTAWANLGGGAIGWSPDGNSNGAIKSIGTNDNFALPFETNGTEKMRLLTNGNLGIGTATPTSLVHLQKSSTADGGNDFMLFENTAVGGSGFQFKNTNASTNLWQAFLSTAGDFKIGRAGIADWMTFTSALNAPAIQFFNSNATGVNAIAIGTSAVASGFYSSTLGIHTVAPSFGETAIGQANVDYTPASHNNFITTDRLFVIGNGGSSINRSNALNMLKNGNTRFGNGNPTARVDVEGEIKISSSGVAANAIGAGGVRWDGTNIQFSNGTAWANLGGGGGGGWSLLGNSATATDFIGTTNNQDIRFKRNNVNSGFISLSNNAFGDLSLFNNTTGVDNNAFGSSSLKDNTTGSSNSAFGFFTLFENTTGQSNSAFGSFALNRNLTGNRNTAFGSRCLYTNTTGSNNIGIGFGAEVPSPAGSFQLSIANKIYGLDLDTTTPKFGFNTPAPTSLLHLNKSVAADGGNSFMLFENSSAGGGAGFQFKNANISANLFQMFLSTAGDFKIGRDNFADYLTIENGGNVGININPAVKLAVAGGVAIANTATFTATSDNFDIIVGNNSYIFVDSNTSNAGARTLVLSNGLAVGQILFLQCQNDGTNFFSLTEGLSNVNFASTTNFDFNGNDIIQLLWNGSDWILINYQNIT